MTINNTSDIAQPLTLSSTDERWREEAWSCLEANLAQNSSELVDMIADYEAETDAEIDLPHGANPMERGVELQDPAFLAWLRSRIEDEADGTVTHYRRLAATNGMIRCWRAIDVPPGWQLPASRSVGVHWSWNREGAVPHFGEREENDWRSIIVEADIPVDAIDWSATLMASLSEEFGDENEIRIFDDADHAGAAHVIACYGTGSAQDLARQAAMNDAALASGIGQATT